MTRQMAITVAGELFTVPSTSTTSYEAITLAFVSLRGQDTVETGEERTTNGG